MDAQQTEATLPLPTGAVALKASLSGRRCRLVSQRPSVAAWDNITDTIAARAFGRPGSSDEPVAAVSARLASGVVGCSPAAKRSRQVANCCSK